jgi:hypothetical protein
MAALVEPSSSQSASDKPPKNVLVLCQRNKTTVDVEYVETIVKQIHDFSVSILRDENVDIKYLTKHDHGTGDYNFALDTRKNNPDGLQSKEFISQHKGKYDLIILNTCGFKNMDIQAVYDLLTDAGIMAFTKFPSHLFTSSEKIMFSTGDESQDISTLINELFIPMGQYIYYKNSLGGKGKKRKSRKRKNSKKLKYKMF